VPDLLLVEAAWSGTDPAAARLNSWATELHDRLDSRGRPTATDRQRLTSWLRVQAVGRDTVTITEPRTGRYAGLWAAAADAAGLSIRLRTTAGGDRRPAADDPAEDPTDVPASAAVDDRWQTHVRGWLLDRAEGVARLVVRAAQR